MHRLSIICVAFNEARTVAGFQRAVDALRRPEGVSVETILIDGGSRDGTPDGAEKAGFTKVVVLPGANIPVCRNRGLSEATGDWIAFLDADCEPDEDWITNAHPLMTNQKILILGWPAKAPDPMTWVQAAWHFHWTQKNPRLENFGGSEAVVHEGFRLVTTRNMILHKVVADRIGRFNEELATGEDTDFAFRAHQAGIPVVGLPSLKVVHHGEPKTLGQFFRQQLWHANRRSYVHIKKLSGGKVGGNAPRFTAFFLASLLLAVAAVICALVLACPFFLLGLLPLVAVIAGPALVLSLRGRTLRYLPALCVLYGAYGIARSLDLLGLHPQKLSWKSR